MRRMDAAWQWWFKRLAWLVSAAIVVGCLLSFVVSQAVGSPLSPPAWSNPKDMAIRRASATLSSQSEPNLFNNLDCSLVTYRQASTSTMLTGCFTETAFGLMDSDSATVIFNGTDEGLPLLPSSAHQVLVPWPKALDLIALDAVSTGGSYISLYKNPVAALQDQRSLLGQLLAKQLVQPPELALRDPSGQRLVINAQTIAFSDGGSWLLAETLSGSFVRINLATLEVTAFAPSFGSQGSPALLKSRLAISDNGQFVAIANQTADSFNIYDLDTCSGPVVNLQPRNCQAHDYQHFAKTQVPGLVSIGHTRFINQGLLSFEATASNAANSGIYELAPTATITSLTDYTGLGDSYTSGEGAFDYVADTDSSDNMCHLSRRSYPLLLTSDLFSSIGGHSVACSGAVINDIGSTSDSYRGQVREGSTLEQLRQSQPLLFESIETNFVPGFIAQHWFVKRWQPRVVTVSVGGDDIGFGDLIQNCVEPHVSRHTSDSTCYNTYEDRQELMQLIDRTMPRWTALYRQLGHEAPEMRLYVIGYPQIIADNGDCSLNVLLSKSELEFAAGLIDYLNEDIQKAALAAGVTYVDIGQALAGHRLCETATYNVAVNGLTAGNDAGLLGTKIFAKESYHPNAMGQELIEQTILRQTHNLESPAIATTSTSGKEALLKAPKTGRPLKTRLPDSHLSTGAAKRGSSLKVQANGARNGLKAGSPYSIKLDGTTGTPLGTASSDTTGTVDTTVTIPDSTPPGGHTIDVTGENQAGEPVEVSQPLYVPASDDDIDDDGIPNALDSCPGAINSGRDLDQDGIDDICDNVIGIAQTTVSTGGDNDVLVATSSRTNLSKHATSGSYTAVLGKTARRNAEATPINALSYPEIATCKPRTVWPWLFLLFILLVLAWVLRKYIKARKIQLQ